MTQQTTVERIETILRRDLDVDVIVSRGGDPHYNEPDIVGVNVAAQTIAAEIDALTRERDEARAELAGLDAGMRFQFDRAEDYKAQRDEARAEVERLRPAAEAWRQVFELQAKYSTHWRLNDETYWLARFMEEVGELAGALVGNHVGPVEWELSQLAAIALNWLDMRARAAKERKP